MNMAQRKKQDKMSDKHNQQAADPSASAWVSANAGSGKTYILVTRLVALLLEGTPAERLLCLTHTRNAAAEMKERLFQLLGEWAILSDDDLKQAMAERIGKMPSAEQIKKVRVLFARALETPGGLKVQTIHAFCESLLHRFPLEAGVPPGFQLLDERMAAELTDKVYRELLADYDKPKLAETLNLLLRHFSEKQFAALAKQIIDNRKIFAATPSSERKATLLKRMKFKDDVPNPTEIKHDIIRQLDPHDIEKVIKILMDSSVKDQEQANRFATILDDINTGQHVDKIWENLCNVFFTQAGTPREKPITETLKRKRPDIAEQVQSWEKLCIEGKEEYNQALTAQLTLAIYHFADALLDKFVQRKQEIGQLDYDDLIAKTSDLLTTRQATAWVLYKLDGGLDHILVDEAQDTSPQQWRVIQSLAEEFFAGDASRQITRTIFAVGDEKQSIFSFQGANPEAFDKMRTHFEEQAANAVQKFFNINLDISRRSTPEILAAVDLICELSLMQDSLTQQKQAIKHQAYREEEAGFVEVWDYESAQKADSSNQWEALAAADPLASPSARVAVRIAQQIKDWMDNPQSGISPRDILILVQYRKPFAPEMLRALKKFNIPVNGADRMKLTEQIVIMDLIAAGHAALLPEDDLNMACFLRSPLGGISEEELYNLCYERGKTDLRTRLRQAAGTDHASPAIKSAWARLQEMLGHVDYLPPFEFYMRLLDAQKGRTDLIGRLGAEVDDPVNEFLNLALDYERHYPPSLQGFLHWVMHGDVEVKRDMEQGGDAVRIMTIHGAKGLEAPVVFMPDTCRLPSQSRGESVPLAILDERLPIWRAKKEVRSALGQSASEKARALQEQEHKRLFYVAMTRARDRLYIGGFIGANRKAPPEGSWYTMAQEIIRRKGKAIETEQGTVWRMGDVDAAKPRLKIDAKHAPDFSAPPPDWLHQPARKEAADIDIESPSSFLSKDMAGNMGALPNRKTLLRGEVIHRLIEGLADVAPQNRLSRAEAFMARYSEDFDNQERDTCIKEALRIFDVADLAPLFDSHSRAEMHIAGELTLPSGTIRKFSGRIDRYAEMDDEIVLADYKTNRIPPASAAAVPQGYITQMALYRALVAAAQPDKPVRCLLIWTSTAQWHGLDNAAMDAALHALS